MVSFYSSFSFMPVQLSPFQMNYMASLGVPSGPKPHPPSMMKGSLSPNLSLKAGKALMHALLQANSRGGAMSNPWLYCHLWLQQSHQLFPQVTNQTWGPLSPHFGWVLGNCTFSHEWLKAEFGWQLCVGAANNATTWKDFQTKMLVQFDLWVFAFASPGSLVVQLLHSVASFFLPGTGLKWRGKVIGFMVNKMVFQTPHLIILKYNKYEIAIWRNAPFRSPMNLGALP